MPKNGGFYDDNVLLLCPENRGGKWNRFPEPHLEVPIIKGVASQLRRWPTDLFFAFLAACLIIGCLIFLILVTVALCLPSTNANRVTKTLDIGDSSNVYFLKLGNQTWSTTQLCYVETAVHWNPNLQFYIINLWSDKRSGQPQRNAQNASAESEENYLLRPTSEEHLRNQLISRYTNIRHIDVSIEAFFKGSKLAEIAASFDDGMLETAAKAQLLWNSPGIALNPDMYCSLNFVKKFLCVGEMENCEPNRVAAIEPINNIQISGVPCQAFLGFLMDEMWRSRANESVTLGKVLNEYCARQYYCPGITIFHLDSKCSRDAVDCPIVSSTVIPEDELYYTKMETQR